MPMVRFALASLLAVIVAGAIGVTLQRNAAREDAIRDARTLAHLAGDGIVAPNVNQALLDGMLRGMGNGTVEAALTCVPGECCVTLRQPHD